MKILFNLLDAAIGGGQQVALGVAGVLVRRGHTIGVAVPQPGPALADFKQLGATVHQLDLISLRHPAGVVAGSRATRRYDVLYSHTSVPGEILAGAAAKLARRPHVVHRHIYPHFSQDPRLARTQRALYRQMLSGSAVIAVARHIADDLVAVGVASDQITVIPNGVAVPPLTAPPQPSGPVRVGLLGRLDPQKGIDTLIEAVGLGRFRPDQVEFSLGAPVATDAPAQSLVDSATRVGIDVRLGAKGPEFLAGLDILVMPSRWEGHPLVLLEAMALGKAVIASDIPGVREVIAPSDAGLLVPVADADALVAAIRSLVSDPNRRGELGRRARVVVETEFRLDARHEQIVRVLEDAFR